MDIHGENAEPETPVRNPADCNASTKLDKLPSTPFLKFLGYGTGIQVVRIQRSMSADVGRSPWAIKMLAGRGGDENEVFRERLLEEAKLLKTINHPNIVGYRGFGTMQEGRKYLALECVGEVSLGRILEARFNNNTGPLEAPKAMQVVSEVLKGLDYLHTKALILHGDMKSFNILVMNDYEVVKICDFGVSLHLKPDGFLDAENYPTEKYVGTGIWSAPEVLDEDPKKISVKADIFSFGLVIYEMLVLVPPHTFPGIKDESIATSAEYASMRNIVRPTNRQLNMTGDVIELDDDDDDDVECVEMPNDATVPATGSSDANELNEQTEQKESTEGETKDQGVEEAGKEVSSGDGEIKVQEAEETGKETVKAAELTPLVDEKDESKNKEKAETEEVTSEVSKEVDPSIENKISVSQKRKQGSTSDVDELGEQKKMKHDSDLNQGEVPSTNESVASVTSGQDNGNADMPNTAPEPEATDVAKENDSTQNILLDKDEKELPLHMVVARKRAAPRVDPDIVTIDDSSDDDVNVYNQGEVLNIISDDDEDEIFSYSDSESDEDCDDEEHWESGSLSGEDVVDTDEMMESDEEDEEDGPYLNYGCLGTRPPIPSEITLGEEYATLLALFYVCTISNKDERPTAAVLLQGLENGGLKFDDQLAGTTATCSSTSGTTAVAAVEEPTETESLEEKNDKENSGLNKDISTDGENKHGCEESIKDSEATIPSA